MRLVNIIQERTTAAVTTPGFCACPMAAPLVLSTIPPGGSYAEVYRYAWEQVQRATAQPRRRAPYSPSLN